MFRGSSTISRNFLGSVLVTTTTISEFFDYDYVLRLSLTRTRDLIVPGPMTWTLD